MQLQLHERYKTLKTAGQGGIGTATLLCDTYLDRQVILKRVENIASLRRLEDEIKSLQAAKSNHVVQIYDLVFPQESKSVPYGIIEEFVPGNDLTQYSYQESPNEYLPILYQIACGLTDLHSCNIIHRDIKPNNIKIDNEGIVKIFDFNLAKTGPTPTSTTCLAGTLGYMAPELYNNPPIINFCADTYAFGILAFYLATRKLPPFAGTRKRIPRLPNQTETIQKFITLPPFVADVLNACVDTEMEKRPAMHEVRNVLKKELTRNSHKCKLMYEQGSDPKEIELSSKNPTIVLARGSDKIALLYDGLAFKVHSVEGDVKINTIVAEAGMELTGSYVIIIGADHLKYDRIFVTCDVSNVEYML